MTGKPESDYKTRCCLLAGEEDVRMWTIKLATGIATWHDRGPSALPAQHEVAVSSKLVHGHLDTCTCTDRSLSACTREG